MLRHPPLHPLATRHAGLSASAGSVSQFSSRSTLSLFLSHFPLTESTSPCSYIQSILYLRMYPSLATYSGSLGMLYSHFPLTEISLLTVAR